MTYIMPIKKRFALVAHDSQKSSLVDWVKQHHAHLQNHEFWATGTTGKTIQAQTELHINCLKSGPLGGDQQIGAMIAEQKIDILIFFIDSLSALPHDVDVKALIRISTLYQIPFACNVATADFIIQSMLLNQTYKQKIQII